jgi:hypothetical protein
VHKEQPRQLENKITVEIIRDVRGNGRNYNDGYSKGAIQPLEGSCEQGNLEQSSQETAYQKFTLRKDVIDT